MKFIKDHRKNFGCSLGKEAGTLYMTTSSRDVIALASVRADTELWHNMLGQYE